METKIIIINIDGSTNKELEDIQLELFKQGYQWADGAKIIDKYLRNPIVIIDKTIYTMDNNGIKYLSNEENIKIIRIDDVTTYFRNLKIKKIRKI